MELVDTFLHHNSYSNLHPIFSNVEASITKLSVFFEYELQFSLRWVAWTTVLAQHNKALEELKIILEFTNMSKIFTIKSVLFHTLWL